MSKTIGWLIALLVVVGLIWWWRAEKTEYGAVSPSPSPTASTSPFPGINASGTLKYADALKLYADRKIQFDAVCHGLPGQSVVKNGTKMLLDNRSADTKTLKLDGVSYILRGFNFRVVTLASKTLPHTVGIDCRSANGNGENTATVLIEK